MILKSDSKMGFIKSVQRELHVTDCSIWAGDGVQKLVGHQLFQVKTRRGWTSRIRNIYLIRGINQVVHTIILKRSI